MLEDAAARGSDMAPCSVGSNARRPCLTRLTCTMLCTFYQENVDADRQSASFTVCDDAVDKNKSKRTFVVKRRGVVLRLSQAVGVC